MMPWLVLTMTTPRPPSTRGMSVLVAYTRRPGLLTRLRPLITGTLPTYLSFRRSTGWAPSRASSKFSMKPSSRRISAIARLVREAGTMISVWRARLPLRMRVSMSAMGSEMFIVLPARLGHAAEVADPRQGQAGQPLEEVPHALAAQGDLGPDRVAGAHAELGDRAPRAGDDGLLPRDRGHVADRRVEPLGVGEPLAQT